MSWNPLSAGPPITLMVVTVLAIGCPPHPSTTPATASHSVTPMQVPPGCSINLSGPYVHASDSSYRYSARDDGTTLTIDVSRASSDGGTFTPKGSPSIRLVRTPKGFLGRTRGIGVLQSGEVCPAVEFLTEVVGCSDAGIVLRSAASARVNEACLPPELASPPPLLEQRLIRAAALSPSTSDGG